MSPTDRAAQISRMLDANPKLDRLKEPRPPRIPEDIPEPSPERKAKIAGWVAVLAPALRDLAIAHQAYGVTALDTRRLAIEHGFATGSEQDQRALSWSASVPRAAKLIATKEKRLGPNRNEHTVYVAPEWAK